MKINEHVHQVKICFQLTPQIQRYVYVYIITGRHCYLVDTGVHGSETIIKSYLESIGKSLSDIKGIFLTHSHPDHIGAAHAIKEASGAPIYACRGESAWMEDIDIQWKERPIPGFYSLLSQSITIDHYIKDKDQIPLESGLTLEVLETSGHSKESLSFYLKETQTLFTGDAIPVRGDIPIFVSHSKSLETLLKLRNQKQVSQFCPAWDHAYDREQGLQAIEDGYNYLETIQKAASTVMLEAPNAPEKDRFLMVCGRLSLDSLALNPLFFQSVHAVFEETVISQLPLPPSVSCTDKGSPHTLL